MYAAAYAIAAPAGELRVWVGLFDVAQPAVPTLAVEGVQAQVSVFAPLAPIREHTHRAGAPRNHRCILRAACLQPGAAYTVHVNAGGGVAVEPLRLRTLPAVLPGGPGGAAGPAGAALDASFNILLCSCYSRPDDDGGLVGVVATQIKRPIDMVLMMGDQIYGDLPIFEDLPQSDAGVAEVLFRKYVRNFAHASLGAPGLSAVLARGPAACVADDHEYWNNYPYRQAQLPKTWTEAGRAQWGAIARDLYEDFQLDQPAGGTKRVELPPLSMLVVDMRSRRDDRFGDLLPPRTLQELLDWAQDLQARHAAGEPVVGALVSGQALMVAPAPQSRRVSADAEMANYAQYRDAILPVLERLARAGVPVLYITGDVHWSRVARARSAGSDRIVLHEVIVSPSCLIRVPVLDRGKELFAGLRGLIGKAPEWPRHGEADEPPPRLTESGRLVPLASTGKGGGMALRGDRLAVLSLSRAGGGVDFQVNYYGVSRDKGLSRSVSSPVYSMRPLPPE